MGNLLNEIAVDGANFLRREEPLKKQICEKALTECEAFLNCTVFEAIDGNEIPSAIKQAIVRAAAKMDASPDKSLPTASKALLRPWRKLKVDGKIRETIE